MAERLNCVQNQVTIANRVPSAIRSLVLSSSAARTTSNPSPARCSVSSPSSASSFRSSYIAHSRGWSHRGHGEQCRYRAQSTELAQGAHELAGRLLDLAGQLIGEEPCVAIERGGRKASPVGKRDARLLTGPESAAHNPRILLGSRSQR
jgi:hypothetical protein